MFCRQGQETGLELKIHVLDARREVRLDRVHRRNEDRGVAFAMEVSEQVFEITSDTWVASNEIECGKPDVEFVVSSRG